MCPDVYPSVTALAACEQDWASVRLEIWTRGSPIVILAPHGGGIEPGTAELAAAIAGAEHTLYCLVGQLPDGNRRLHVTSVRFDEPACLALLARAHTALAVHGCGGRSGVTYVGGRHTGLKDALLAALRAAGFRAEPDNGHHCGQDPANICNRGRLGAGAQLELDEALRHALFTHLHGRARRRPTALFAPYVAAVRAGLDAVLPAFSGDCEQ